ncbi:hypothetical protein [Vibrio sp. MED222]|uniref:hypothetical protein n=1 Tax=Vibrio sp. MED222 TaxID=314290 RepID=UPI000068EB9E|nr:hypothetical protein [Vibrio sp. MED222]EAQ55527.1 hypothetical protein MED222_08903 [Vibrio sp. MED222]
MQEIVIYLNSSEVFKTAPDVKTNRLKENERDYLLGVLIKMRESKKKNNVFYSDFIIQFPDGTRIKYNKGEKGYTSFKAVTNN